MTSGQMHVLQHIRGLRVTEMGEAADAELLDCFVRGHDEAAFAAVVRRHGPLVLGVCRRLLDHDHDAEDACQAVFLVLASKAGSIRKKESLGSWLHGVAYRVAVKLRRELARRRDRECPVHDSAQADPGDVSWREVRAILDEELQHLPERLRAPLLLCYLEGKTRDEAARALGLSVSTLRGRLERGRERLRRRLVRRGLTFPAALLAAAVTAPSASAMPTTLAGEILRTALSGGGGVPAHLASLAEEILNALFLARLKSVVALLITLLLLAGGVAITGRAVSGAGQEPQGEQPRKPAVQRPEQRPPEREPPGVSAVIAQAQQTAESIDPMARLFVLMMTARTQARVGDRTASAKTFEKALQLCKDDRARPVKFQWMHWLARAQADAGDLSGALNTAAAIPEKGTGTDLAVRARADAVQEIALVQAEAGDIKAALTNLGNIKHLGISGALSRIAVIQAKARDMKGALATLDEVKGPERSRALGEIAVIQVKAGDVPAALKTAGTIEHGRDRANALAVIAALQAKAGHKEAAEKTFKDALEAAEKVDPTVPDPVRDNRADALIAVAKARAATGDMEEAIRIADALPDTQPERYPRLARYVIAVERVEAGDFNTALKLVDRIDTDALRDEALKRIAVGQAAAGQNEGAFRTIKAIKRDWERARALLDISKAQATRDDRDSAIRTLQEALRVADKVSDPPDVDHAKASVLTFIASAQAELGLAGEALAWIEKEKDASLKALALAGLAEGMVKRQEAEKKPKP